jgi:hypothetical protein
MRRWSPTSYLERSTSCRLAAVQPKGVDRAVHGRQQNDRRRLESFLDVVASAPRAEMCSASS